METTLGHIFVAVTNIVLLLQTVLAFLKNEKREIKMFSKRSLQMFLVTDSGKRIMTRCSY